MTRRASLDGEDMSWGKKVLDDAVEADQKGASKNDPHNPHLRRANEILLYAIHNALGKEEPHYHADKCVVQPSDLAVLIGAGAEIDKLNKMVQFGYEHEVVYDGHRFLARSGKELIFRVRDEL